MATPKAALKGIKASIDAGNFERAAADAQQVLDQDNKNYHALMFLGFAHEKLKHYDEAEKALQSAQSLKPLDVQVFKGLITLYEQQGAAKLDQYHNVAHALAKVYADLEDRDQCQTIIDKYELFVKKYGTRKQYRRGLELLLPTCDLYSILEGRVSHPSHNYGRILESSEAEEGEWIDSQIGERRTRLGARVDQVTREVKSEAIAKFNIEEKYQTLIDWTIDDDVRHDLEERLLQRAYDNLQVVPHDMKSFQRDKVLNTANGMVIIKHRFALAWNIALEWVDAEDLGDWDVNIFREFIEFFPEEGLSKVLRGFLDSKASPFSQKAGDDNKEDSERLSEADQLIIMTQGMENAQNSMLAHRIMAYTYLLLDETQSAAEMARNAQKLYLGAQSVFALALQDSIDAVNLTLANALITYQSPRHHPEARSLFQEILSRKPTLTSALLGVGLILEEDEDYGNAVKFLDQALSRDPGNLRIRLEHAWCHALDQDLSSGLAELEEVLTELESHEQVNLEMKAEALYRIAYCKWHLDSTTAARKEKSGSYRYLIESVKANASYAPAYTLLGIYFQDYGKSKQRSRVALQKAFELSTSELTAAERLAKAFARSGEWDLVELVAQRVVDSGKARPAPGSKKKAFSWPYAALGVVQMNRQQYSQSIVSFQAALRISPQDYHSWVGLGESYHNSGRFIAASRAFNRAESIDHGLPSDESWFAKYMLANVQREVGAFDDAIQAYEAVLDIKGDEFGVLLALLQTGADNAWAKILQGLFGRAVHWGQKALVVAQRIANHRIDVFNLWKSVADACSAIAHCKSFAANIDVGIISALLQTGSRDDSFGILAGIDKVGIDMLSTDDVEPADKFLFAAILASKRAIHASAHDTHAQAVSWYNLGWSEHEAYLSAGPQLMSKDKRPIRLLKTAIRCFKKAIELEAGNSDFWNALGVTTMTLNSKISQHSLIRSLHLNERSARVWTNLGTLYVLNNDIGLANDAFTRAQSADPEYSAAWVGQGLLAMLYGSAAEAHGLFLHAFEIADSSSIPAKRQYAVSAFDQLLKADPTHGISTILQPLFALRQLRTQQPFDTTTSHLLSLYAERVGEFETAGQALEKVCSTAENEYEKSESTDYLVRYAQAKADLARTYLGSSMYQEALENAETAIDLSAEDVGPAYASQREKWRLSAHITAGLAHSQLDSLDQAIEMFRIALEEADHDPVVVCMLAQVLWAKGGKAAKDAARAQLLACVENYPDHVQAVSLLAVIGLLDNDEDVLNAVEDDLRAFQVSDKVNVTEKLEVSKVLASIVTCNDDESSADKTLMMDALQSVMLSPAQPQGWLELARATEDESATAMALVTAMSQIPPRGTLAADELAKAYAVTNRAEDSQVAAFLAPWLYGALE